MFREDPLVPSGTLLPQSDTRYGAQIPLVHEPGGQRPYSAMLAVPPLEWGKHETTSTRRDEDKATQESKDGVVVPDTVTITHTDT
jgi:hypothetical protein